MKKNGKIEADTYDIQEYLVVKKCQFPLKITKLCDIYSIGAIIFKLLIGRAPT
jgi:serine/threonine protein kinase